MLAALGTVLAFLLGGIIGTISAQREPSSHGPTASGAPAPPPLTNRNVGDYTNQLVLPCGHRAQMLMFQGDVLTAWCVKGHLWSHAQDRWTDYSQPGAGVPPIPIPPIVAPTP
jgi:hypothetical protein